MSFANYLNQSAEVLTESALDPYLQQALNKSIHACVEALSKGLPVLVCGNGGSASDAQHIAGELVGRYKTERRAFNVICLSDNAAILTALGNDYGYDEVFRRQVEGYGKKGGILIGLSTSGNSANILKAFEEAVHHGMTRIAFTGESGGKLKANTDILISAPSSLTPMIQQAHLCYYHYMCQEIESALSEYLDIGKVAF